MDLYIQQAEALSARYYPQWIAIANGEVLSSGDSEQEARVKAMDSPEVFLPFVIKAGEAPQRVRMRTIRIAKSFASARSSHDELDDA
jgi:hypothetical protein